jgi:sulfite reductase alpha subunit-like flavoprotein
MFALGNSTYEQFCAVGRRVDARLAEFGGNRVLVSRA